jgi:ammonium transporter, Amt family
MSEAPTSYSPLTAARLLLVEDDAIVRKVTLAILNRAGYTCCNVAVNGREAVEAVLHHPFDLVIMDCNMPVMDGFEAVREIRKLERDGRLPGSRTGRLPIIALSADVFSDSGENCLDAGMDGFVTKPIDRDSFTILIRQMLSGEARADQRPASGRTPPPPTGQGKPRAGDVPAGFDMSALLERCSGDEALAWRLIRLFQKNGVTDFRRLEDLVEEGDCQGIIETAHRLKGSAIYVSADRVRHVAGELEEMARQGDLQQAARTLQVLERELADFSPNR